MIDIQDRFVATCRSVFILLAIALLSGCNSNTKNPHESLKFFGMTYYNYQQIWKRPPSNWEEILTMANAKGLEADYEMLMFVRESDYTIIWNVDCRASNPHEHLLAYEPSSLTTGGRVLFADGSLRSLPAEELADIVARAKEADEHR